MWRDPQFPADLVTFTEEILSGKLHFLCSACGNKKYTGSVQSKLVICSFKWVPLKVH